MERSTTTAIAVAIGTAVGAAAALDGGEPAARPAAQPISQPTTGRSGTARNAPPSPSPTASVSAPGPAVPGRDPLDEQPVSELELSCARRDPRACLATARAYESGRGTERDESKARLHRSLAVSLLNERCTARRADACQLLSELYAAGTGVAKNADTASALHTRALELCRGKTDADCARIRAGLLR